jgi:spermidine synthase
MAKRNRPGRRGTESKEGKAAAGASPPRQPTPRTHAAFLVVAAFLGGAGVMVIELCGNRVLAPWFGNSLYTWTGLIGVVLVAMSAGYLLGGWLADRKPDYAVMAHLLAAAAVLTLLIPVLQSALRGSLEPMSIVWGPVAASLLLLAVPGCLLAAVSPFAVKLLSGLAGGGRVGISAGTVSTASTLGSVLGTFAAGFLLIPHLPLRAIFVGVAVVVGGLAVVGYALFVSTRLRRRGWIAASAAALALLAVVAGTEPEAGRTVIFEKTTFYHRIQVTEHRDHSGQLARYLLLDTTYEGGQYVRGDGYPLGYQRSWELARLLVPDLERAAFLGGGGFLMPQALLDAFPDAEADVVEIDPAVIEVGRQYFRVDDYPRMNAAADDARRFLRRSPHRYDFIYGDAYSGVRNIPGHLTTVEFFELVASRLSDRGVYAMNVRSAIRGDEAVVFGAIYNTLREVFPFVGVVALDPRDLSRSQNVILVAAGRELPLAPLAAAEQARGGPLAHFLAGYLPPETLSDVPGPVLRDQHNPIEYLIARSLLDR